MVNYLDLFSGIGGFALGAYWAGFRCDNHYFSDIEPYAVKLYQQRFPDAIPLGDITKINGKELPYGEWIITGGFPCQDISTAGKGAGLGGARSGLWFEYARIISELRPRYAIVENVGALVARGLGRVLGSLAEIGYDAEWLDIRASDCGAPHKRERIWIVAYPKKINVEKQEMVGSSLQEETNWKSGRTPIIHACKICPSSWERNQPEMVGMGDGVSYWVDRSSSIGNSIIPKISKMIFEAINQ